VATYNKFQSFVEAVNEKKHDFSADTLKVFLTNSSPSATNTQLSNITEIDYTDCSSRTLTISSSSQTSGTYSLKIDDLVLTSSGTVGPFRYVGIYNDTSTNDLLICWFDHGSNVTMTNGSTYTIDFSTSGLFTLA